MPRTGNDRNDLAELYESLMWIIPAINPKLGQIEPPERYKRPGLIAYADGVNWNPNSQGAGYYRFTGSAWVKLLEPDDTFATSINAATSVNATNADTVNGLSVTSTPTANSIVASPSGSQYIDKGWLSTDLPRYYYESSPQTITSAGNLNLAHGLPAVPRLIQVVLQCVVAQGNYAVGDTVAVSYGQAGTNQGVAVIPNSTTLYIRYGSSTAVFTLLDKVTGAGFSATNANWRAIFRAWA